MSQVAPAKLPNDDFIALVRLSKFTGVPIPEVAGILICNLFDSRDQAMLAEMVYSELVMYRNQLTIRWPGAGLDENLYPVLKEDISDEQSVTTDLDPS